MTELEKNNKTWNFDKIEAIYNQPFMDLLHEAATVHRKNFDPNKIQTNSIMSIKTGSCPEDCAYCPQSGHFKTGIEKEKFVDIEKVLENAKAAKDKGATRFCMGAAWRKPPKKYIPEVKKIISEVKSLGLETCMTLGMLDEGDAKELKDAGLDYYNHNLDTSREYYEKIITTRTYDDRLDTLDKVRKAGINVCCGGIIGMGETKTDRINFLLELVNLPTPPQSVPINQLAPAKGTPMENLPKLMDSIEFVRTIATARILMPSSYVRLSAGRDNMNTEMQALCFYAGANSIWYAQDKIFITKNPNAKNDQQLFSSLGLKQESTA